ncbi:hypothetical protein ENBRE01_0261 [Enteropsectra breve]|nr:hypothetical protein ENBRE01_0261 [Enteropsectra breve]
MYTWNAIYFAIQCLCKSAHSAADAKLDTSAQENGYYEEEIARMNYIPGKNNELIGVQNVVLNDEGLFMRSGLFEGSALHWEEEYTEENWAFVCRFNEPNLGAEERASIYMRYTSDTPKIGSFKGGEDAFHGLHVGLEFKGKSVRIVYSSNAGLKYEGAEEYASHSDFINPRRFRSIDELTLKVISTAKNFKIEIYSKDKVIFDKFMLFDPSETKLIKAGKYFGIIANYSHAASGKAFILHEAKVYRRTEFESYVPQKSKTVDIVHTARDHGDVNHHNSDIKEFIHIFENISEYLKDILGEFPQTIIMKGNEELSDEINRLAEKVSKLKEVIKPEHKNTLPNLNSLEIKIQTAMKEINNIHFIAKNTIAAKKQSMNGMLNYGLFGAGCALLGVISYNEVLKFMSFKKCIK